VSVNSTRYGAALCGICESGQVIETLHGRLCDKMVGLPICAPKFAMEVQIVRRKVKVKGPIINHWQYIMCLDTE